MLWMIVRCSNLIELNLLLNLPLTLKVQKHLRIDLTNAVHCCLEFLDCSLSSEFLFWNAFVIFLSVIVEDTINVAKSIRTLLLLLCSICKRVLCFLLQVLQEPCVHFLVSVFSIQTIKTLQLKFIFCICMICVLGEFFKFNTLRELVIYYKKQGICDIVDVIICRIWIPMFMNFYMLCNLKGCINSFSASLDILFRYLYWISRNFVKFDNWTSPVIIDWIFSILFFTISSLVVIKWIMINPKNLQTFLKVIMPRDYYSCHLVIISVHKMIPYLI